MMRESAGKSGRGAVALFAILTVTACTGGRDDNAIRADETLANTMPPVAGTTNGTSIMSGSLAEFQDVVGDTIRFSTDSYELDATAQGQLQKQAAWLTQNRHWNVVLEGHADERGTREYNLALGERRATSATNYLVALGVAAARISVVSYGKERPICAEATEACWAENRRAVTTLDE